MLWCRISADSVDLVLNILGFVSFDCLKRPILNICCIFRGSLTYTWLIFKILNNRNYVHKKAVLNMHVFMIWSEAKNFMMWSSSHICVPFTVAYSFVTSLKILILKKNMKKKKLRNLFSGFNPCLPFGWRNMWILCANLIFLCLQQSPTSIHVCFDDIKRFHL